MTEYVELLSLNKAFLPHVAFVKIFYQSHRKETKTDTLPSRRDFCHPDILMNAPGWHVLGLLRAVPIAQH